MMNMVKKMMDSVSNLYRLGSLLRNFHLTKTNLSIEYSEPYTIVVKAEKEGRQATAVGYDLCSALDKCFRGMNHGRISNP